MNKPHAFAVTFWHISVKAAAKACETKENVYLRAEEARIRNQQETETKKYVHCVSIFVFRGTGKKM
jgi:CRISPR/Cas system-associated exonuclease Cas4 (RecB family)